MGDNFGMMEGAYFVGRNELLNWLNELLQLGYSKVEQVASGASHCQVMDAIYPGKVPLHKVNFNARFEYEYVKNYKVLQEIFNKVGIDRFIDVQKLIKAKYQDNLEFLQWIKRYFDLHFPGGKYDAVERRKESKSNYEGDTKPSLPVQEMLSRPTAPATTKPPKVDSTASSRAKPAVRPPSTQGSSVPPPSRASSVLKPVNRDTSKPPAGPVKTGDKPQQGDAKAKTVEEDYKAKLADMNQQVVQLRLAVDNLEKERDFYFNKLREVEILFGDGTVQTMSSQNIAEGVLKILYATDDDNTFGSDATPEAQ